MLSASGSIAQGLIPDGLTYGLAAWPYLLLTIVVLLALIAGWTRGAYIQLKKIRQLVDWYADRTDSEND